MTAGGDPHGHGDCERRVRRSRADLEIRELRASSTTRWPASRYTLPPGCAMPATVTRGLRIRWRPGESSPFILVAENLDLDAATRS